MIASPPLLLLCAVAGVARAATPMTHGWDTVADIMAMHGKYKTGTATTTQADLIKGAEFAAQHYAYVTTGTGCGGAVNATATIEESVWALAAAMKAKNPQVKVGMYWRTDMALEVRSCSAMSAEWNANAKAWSVLDDAGKPVMKGSSPYINYAVPAAADFFSRLILNTLKGGQLDYVYFDGVGDTSSPHFAGVGLNRSMAILEAKLAMIHTTQAKLDAIGKGQNLILNGLDDAEGAVEHTASGAAGSMFDHWSVLQFLNREPQSKSGKVPGTFNVTMMEAAFALAANPIMSNQTKQIKGWPGPIIRQPDEYPTGMVQPNTTALKQQIGLQRFNSELALFLLVAGERDYWIYSWFWGFWDYVPGDASSSVGAAFYPQAKCKLGAPTGAAVRKTGTWTYDRTFEHATVHVDLTDRLKSFVKFDASC